MLARDAVSIFNRAVDPVNPARLMQQALSVTDNTLSVEGRTFPINNNVYLIGFAKAVMGMMVTAENILGRHLVSGIGSVPKGIHNSLRSSGKHNLLPGVGSRLHFYEGAANNLPDDDAYRCATQIHTLATSLTSSDLCLVFISGGGSALLPAPPESVPLCDKLELTRLLSRAGATIQELNTVRKLVSVLKGGGLARCIYPATTISFILSDIIGSPLDLIACGPTVPCYQTSVDAFKIFSRYNVCNQVPQSVIDYLSTIEPDNRAFPPVYNVLNADNTTALDAARECAESLGYQSVVFSSAISGEARRVGEFFANLALATTLWWRVKVYEHHKDYERMKSLETHLQDLNFLHRYQEITGDSADVAKAKIDFLINKITKWAVDKTKSICILAGGETVVTVRGTGIGGRNQEMALSCGVRLHQCEEQMPDFKVEFISAGTDGQDGPTTAAGARTTAAQIRWAIDKLNLNPESFLLNNDSNSFFTKLCTGDLIITGLTGTNVMDIHALLISHSVSG